MTKNTLLYSGVLAISILAFSSFAFSSNVNAYGLTAAGAPSCNNTAPGTPFISSIKAIGGGSIELFWNGVDRASSWTVAYGTESGKYIYGVHNFGDGVSKAIKISNLPNGRYYFVLRANNGCAPGAFSAEKNSYTSGGGGTYTEPVTYTVPDETGEESTPKPVISATPSSNNKYLVSPKPLATVTPIPSPTGSISLWQRILNFFNSLFK